MVGIDGGTHGCEAEVTYDEMRTAMIEPLGYRVFRAHNIDIYANLERVLDALLENVSRR